MPLLFERILALSLLAFSGLTVAGEMNSLASPTLTTDTDIATAGYFRLSWSVPELQVPVDFELQKSATADFSNHSVIYTGPDRATTFSGLGNGEYYFRIRSLISDQSSSWSAVTKVQVQHHSLTRAWIFFALGAVVFMATLMLVMRGATERHNA